MDFTFTYLLLGLGPSPDPNTAPNPTGQMLQLLGTFAIMGVMLYFVLIRPQQKRAKEHAALVQSLKPGDKVVTSSGIIGVIVGVKEKTLSLRSADTKLEVLRSAVTEVTEKSSEKSSSQSTQS